MMRAINPANGELLAEYSEHSPAEVERRLAQAWRAWLDWKSRPFADRAELLLAAARRLEVRRDDDARLMSNEMGKPITQSIGEIDKCAWVLRHYAENAESLLAPTPVQTDARRSFVRFDPLGPILAVMPWNFPFWQVFRAAAPALMAGDVLLLKHASNVPGCALALEAIFREAGLPDGCFTTLLVGAGAVDAIIDDDRVRAVTLTGSEPAGRQVAARAGSRIKKTVLELGGSDAFVVLDDADIPAAAAAASTARLINSGQSCIAAKRFIVVERVAESFAAEFTRRVQAARVGDPLDPATEVGPLARADLLDELQRQVDESVALGARVRTGGRRLARSGLYYAPTVLSDVPRHSPAAREETFGPVAAVLVARDDDDAVALANDSGFGLGASLWTRDLARGEALATHIEAGAVFVNGIVKSDPRLPFGGVKRSGYGRELGVEGIREFVNIKSVVIA